MSMVPMMVAAIAVSQVSNEHEESIGAEESIDGDVNFEEALTNGGESNDDVNDIPIDKSAIASYLGLMVAIAAFAVGTFAILTY